MANYEELLNRIDIFKESTDDSIYMEKVDVNKILGIGVIAAGVAGITALVMKVIKDKEVENIIKNDKELSELMKKMNTKKAEIDKLAASYSVLFAHYYNKVMEYNEYARMFGDKTIVVRSYTPMPYDGDVVVVPTTTRKVNENFDPEKKRKYEKLSNEVSKLQDEIGEIIIKLGSDYTTLKTYIKQVKKEVRKYSVVNKELIEKINAKCDELETEIEESKQKLTTFKTFESVNDEIISLIQESSFLSKDEANYLISVL